MSDGLEETGTRVRLCEVLSALSFILDRVEGQPEGHAVRSCFIGMSVAERLGLSEERRSALFYALLLKDAGCSSNASRVAAVLDADDSGAKGALKMVDRERLPQAVAYLARNVGRGRPLRSRVGRFFSVLLRGQREGREFVRIRCERGAEISRFLGFPEGTARTIRASTSAGTVPATRTGCAARRYRPWPGSAASPRPSRSSTPPAAPPAPRRSPATAVGPGSPPRSWTLSWRRRGRTACGSACGGPASWGPSPAWSRARRYRRRPSGWTGSPAPSPASSTPNPPSPTGTPRGSRRPRRRWASAWASRPGRCATRSGRGCYDIGKLGVSSRILDKPGPLTAAERAEIRKHSALTYDILSRVTPFRHLAEVAASHHERPDGKGYHRGLKADALSLRARILAVADTFDALSQDRPYRPAMPMEKVLACLRNESGTGLSPECVEVLEDLVSDGEGCLALGRSAPKVGRDSTTRYP
jgi:hypothetical protein